MLRFEEFSLSASPAAAGSAAAEAATAETTEAAATSASSSTTAPATAAESAAAPAAATDATADEGADPPAAAASAAHWATWAAAECAENNADEDEEKDEQDDQADARQGLIFLALIVFDRRRTGEGDAGVLRDDVGDAARDEEESGVVISLAEDGDGFAAEAADFAVGENSFEAVADLGPIFVVVGGVENEDAAADLLGADAPFCGEGVGVVEDVLAVCGGYGDYGDLGFGFLVDFGAERGEFGFGVGGEDVGEVVDVADGFGGDLKILSVRCERQEGGENQKEYGGACGTRDGGSLGVRTVCEDWKRGHRVFGLAYLI